MAKNKVRKPEKQKPKIDPKEALAALNEMANEKEAEVAQGIEQYLQEKGFKLEVVHKIVVVPIR